jgi:hypothetical protein
MPTALADSDMACRATRQDRGGECVPLSHLAVTNIVTTGSAIVMPK